MMSVKDSTGGWQDNAFVFKTPKGCSALKYYFGTQWDVFFKSFGHKNPNCPIPPVILYFKRSDSNTDYVFFFILGYLGDERL